MATSKVKDQSAAASPAAVDPLALEQQVCFALAVASRSVLAVYRPLLEPMGLTHPQYLVMLALWQRDALLSDAEPIDRRQAEAGQLEPLSVKELGALLQLDSGTLSPLLKRLQAGGLVRRQREQRDERSVTVSLTERGRALRAQAESIPHLVVERLGIDIAELQDLHRTLTLVIAAAVRATS